ncbi:unnamed protein product [Pleuronectes platessa]|uniref:Uncharacterized protein n=1 Tax=Pleuronectes platessa TaxID=8262 RepID=A0A9N7UYR0_PLEPL|nr:unnamed protein product [Pleuronectes platessa]
MSSLLRSDCCSRFQSYQQLSIGDVLDPVHQSQASIIRRQNKNQSAKCTAQNQTRCGGGGEDTQTRTHKTHNSTSEREPGSGGFTDRPSKRSKGQRGGGAGVLVLFSSIATSLPGFSVAITQQPAHCAEVGSAGPSEFWQHRTSHCAEAAVHWEMNIREVSGSRRTGAALLFLTDPKPLPPQPLPSEHSPRRSTSSATHSKNHQACQRFPAGHVSGLLWQLAVLLSVCQRRGWEPDHVPPTSLERHTEQSLGKVVTFRPRGIVGDQQLAAKRRPTACSSACAPGPGLVPPGSCTGLVDFCIRASSGERERASGERRVTPGRVEGQVSVSKGRGTETDKLHVGGQSEDFRGNTRGHWDNMQTSTQRETLT